MTEGSAKHAQRHARQVAMASVLMASRGNLRRAEQAQRRAEDLYEEAGLDPDWHDEEAMLQAQGPDPSPLHVRILNDGKLEATDKRDPLADISGIVADSDIFVVPEP